MFNFLSNNDQVYIWIGIISIAVVIGLGVFLCYKYIPWFKHEDNTKTDAENAQTSVDEIVRNDIDVITEKETWVKNKMSIIDEKAFENHVELAPEDYYFLIMQEKMNDLDSIFRKNH